MANDTATADPPGTAAVREVSSAEGGEPVSVPRAIEAHGVIGDQRTAALVANDGTIDFFCWPRFDGPSVFAALLDPERGGAWEISPVANGGGRGRQMYLPETNVLLTRFSAPDGVGEITDFMPFPEPGGGARLIRRVRAVRGEVCCRLRCTPRLEYARAETRGRAGEGDGTVLFSAAGGGGPILRLAGSVPLRVERGADGDAAVAGFTLRAGEEACFTLLDAKETPPDHGEVDRLFREAVAHWQKWAGRSTYKGRWREAVTRSALALKLLTSEEHGSIAAAATFGLPESPGGDRNWDYRATWIRDASFTVYAFARLGYPEEANAFIQWVGDRVGECPHGDSLRIMYAIDGGAPLEETELAHLRGYGGAAPVRVGNAAYGQVQLDIYGELMDAVYLANKYGRATPRVGWQRGIRILEHLCEHWRDPDQGIWERRGAPQHWLHSRVMCWVALDRAVRLAEKRSLPAPLARWQAVRDEIHASVWEDFWDDERGHLVSMKGGAALDGAMLMLPLVRFVSATDPDWLATLDAIGRELVDDPLVYRYRDPDGLAGREGAFTACSFWYAECLARAGRLAEARLVFEKMLGYANHLGLFSEQVGPSDEALGNTPQALTHLALISAAFYLDRELSSPGQTLWRP